jgi:hypothetical protein
MVNFTLLFILAEDSPPPLVSPEYTAGHRIACRKMSMKRNFLAIRGNSPWSYCIGGSRDSVAGITTLYGLEGLGMESWWGEIFRTYSDRLQSPPSLLYNGYRVFPGGKNGRGVMLSPHPLIVPKLRKIWAIPPLSLWVLLGLLRGSFHLLHRCIQNFCLGAGRSDNEAVYTMCSL